MLKGTFQRKIGAALNRHKKRERDDDQAYFKLDRIKRG